ncbi:MAG: DUF736 domain-containing protein [Bdellovibrionales bacterium]
MKNGKKNSIKIGAFTADKQGVLQGKIYGLGLGVTPVLFEPQTSKDGKSYFRLIADPTKTGYEVGAAFPREKDGMVYHSVSIDSPVLPAPINAALFPDRESGGFNLVWNRQDENKDLKAEATVNVNVQPQQAAQTQSRRANGQQPML